MRAVLRTPLPLALAASLLALAPAPGAAQSPVRSVRVEADNDAFNFWVPVPRPDHDYTHGARVVVDADRAPGWGRLLHPGLRPCTGAEGAEERCLATRWEVGQKIYTPRRDAPDPLPGERPYAGWLYAGATARVAGRAAERTLGVEVGVTGRPSLGEAFQQSLHRLAGFWRPEGWGNQLAFEPGVVLRYGGARLLAEPRTAEGVRVATLAPEWGAALGNVLTGAHAGLRARAGYGVPHPWGAGGAGEARPPVAVYAVAAVRGEWVARSLFLDGNTFRDSPRVERLPVVGEYEVGGGVRVRDLRLEYRVVARGREYRSEPDAHRWSTISVSWQPPR
ncbi:MAG TPA: lipid A deacylase LpxR family protein [Longimicrobiaceae bacterium]